MTITNSAPTPLDKLTGAIDGVLVRPDDPGWDEARQAWQLAVDQQPAAVVLARSVRDIQATIAAASELGLRVAPQSTGHNAWPLGPLEGTVLLKTSGLNAVHIDPQARLARVEAGALWGDVTAAAAQHGLVALAGSSADVGVAGYTLGGGLSWLGRSHGLAANSVVAIDVVTADGTARTVSADKDPDLFWALRGGGGSYAVVTALEFRLYPISEVYAGTLFFPIERGDEILHTWWAWLGSVPETVASVGRLMQFPPLPELPPHLSGQSFALIEAACQLPADEADALLAPLRALGPAMDTFDTIPVTELSALHMDPPGPAPAYGDGMLLSDLPEAAVRAVVEVAVPQPWLTSVEFRHLGGALKPGRMDGGAVDSFDAEFLLYAAGFTADEASGRAVGSAVAGVLQVLAPWATGGRYGNLTGGRQDGAALYGAESYARLQTIKAAYDPADLIRADHPVPPN